MNVSAVIVAGGTGKRMNAGIPKQLLMLGGMSILERTLQPFLACDEITEIVITAAEEIIGPITDSTERIQTEQHIIVVPGGKERQDSVWNGLAALSPESDIVIVHDGVRPFITPQIIKKCIHAAAKWGAVSVMRPVKETVKTVENDRVIETLDRSKLWITQTPQVFRTVLIREAHERARLDGYYGTDDCILVERLGHEVHIIEGDEMNIKITTPADLKIAGAILALFENGERQC
ncbi:MAG: 2-C-methyl-D-erythritol 4-phosphate cytidylyltransferase [Candidatus Latescibacterota bacterium]